MQSWIKAMQWPHAINQSKLQVESVMLATTNPLLLAAPSKLSPHRGFKFEANNSCRQWRQNKLKKKKITCTELAIFTSILAMKLLEGISRNVRRGGCLPGIQLPSSISIFSICASRSDYRIKRKKNNWSSRGNRKERHFKVILTNKSYKQYGCWHSI